MERIEIVNPDAIDRTRPRMYPVGYFWMRYEYGSYLVGKDGGIGCAQDAMDELADWLPDHAPGYIPDDETIADLMKQARDDGRDDDEMYVEERYIRAGNDSHWTEMPVAIEEIREDELIEMLYARHSIHARLSKDGHFIEETEVYSPMTALCYKAQEALQKYDIDAPWEAISEALYGAMADLEERLAKSDRIELPGGTIMQVTWKPERT